MTSTAISPATAAASAGPSVASTVPAGSPGPARSVGPVLPESALVSLRRARAALDEAALSTEPTHRYASAHIAALRATAAVLAVRTRPAGRRTQRNAWTLLVRVAPELEEWAILFSAGAGKRAAAEAGLTRLVSTRDADDLLRDVERYLSVVRRSLGVADQQALPAQVC